MAFGYVLAGLLAVTSVGAEKTAGCDLCSRPDVLKAGTLNDDDFMAFCNNCKAAKEDAAEEPATIAKDDAKIQAKNVSPSSCKVCQRPDVQGLTAGDMYNVDFAGFCTTCKSTYGKAMDLIIALSEDTSGCALCYRSDVMTPGTLNYDDFRSFCTKCPKAKNDEKVTGPEGIKEMDKKIHETNMSPSECKVCERGDVAGWTSSDMYDNDFNGFCSTCNKLYGTAMPAAAVNLATEQTPSSEPNSVRAFMFGFLSCALLSGAYIRHSRQANPQPLLGGEFTAF